MSGTRDRDDAGERSRAGERQRRRKAPRHCEWRGDILHGRKVIAGKLRRWSLRTGDVEVAREQVAKDIARLEELASGRGRIRYKDAAAGWAENIADQVGPRTAKRYAVSLKQLEPQLLGCFLDEVNTRTKMDEIVSARRAAGVTTATIRRDLTAVSSVLTYCDVEINAALARLKKLTERRDPIVLPDLAHVRRVIERCPGRLSALVEAALLTGCRQEELVIVERNKLDHARRQLSVRGKGNKIRTIDLGHAYEVLRTQPARLGCKWLFWHGDGEPYRNVASRFSAIVRGVFLKAYDAFHGTETPRTGPKAARALDELLAAQDSEDWQDIGFRTFTFHHLRHYFAVDYLKTKQGTIYDLQQHLGHASVKTTELYLAFLTAEEKRAAMYGVAATAPPADVAEQRGA